MTETRPRPTLDPMKTHRLAALVALLSLLAACTPPTGDLGTVAPPPPTNQPSLGLPSSEPTPDPTVDPADTPAPGTATPTQSGETITLRVYFFLGSFNDNAGL